MPPHGGHGHGGRGRGGGPFWYGGGPGYDSGGVQIFTADSANGGGSICPSMQVPVVGADGKVYQNACKARLAGTKPATSAMAMKGFGTFGDAAAPAPGVTLADPTTYQVSLSPSSPYANVMMVGPGGAAPIDITQPAELAFLGGAIAGVAVLGIGMLAGSILKSILG